MPDAGQAVHHRHVDVQSDDIGAQRFDGFQSFQPVAGRTDNFNLRVPTENIGNRFAHECGIVHNQDFDFFSHEVSQIGFDGSQIPSTGIERFAPPPAPIDGLFCYSRALFPAQSRI